MTRSIDLPNAGQRFAVCVFSLSPLSDSGNGRAQALPCRQRLYGAIQAVAAHHVVKTGQAQALDVVGVFNGAYTAVQFVQRHVQGSYHHGAQGAVTAEGEIVSGMVLAGFKGKSGQPDQRQQPAADGQSDRWAAQGGRQANATGDQFKKSQAAGQASIQTAVTLIETNQVVKVAQGFSAASRRVRGLARGRVQVARCCGPVGVRYSVGYRHQKVYSWLAPGGVMVERTSILRPRGVAPLDICAQSARVALTAVHRGRVGLATRKIRRKQPRLPDGNSSGFLMRTAWPVRDEWAVWEAIAPAGFLIPGSLTRIAPFFLFSDKKAGLIHVIRNFVMKCSINLPVSGQRSAVPVFSFPIPADSVSLTQGGRA